MKKILIKNCVVFSAMVGWMVLSSWTGGPVPECKNDSLAIIRVVKPVNEMFHIKPVVFVSKGLGRIQEVKVNDVGNGNGDMEFKRTLTGLLSNGYIIQTATETSEAGIQLNTYYLRKKVI